MGFFRPFFTGTYLANTSVLVLFLRNVKYAVRFKHGIELILSVFKAGFFPDMRFIIGGWEELVCFI